MVQNVESGPGKGPDSVDSAEFEELGILRLETQMCCRHDGALNIIN